MVAFAAQGCSLLSTHQPDGPVVSGEGRTVLAVPLLDHRLYAHATDILPSGDIMKRWYWDAPWEVRGIDGSVIRRMYSPDWPSESTKDVGPSITVIHDPQRGTIYEAFFVQKTNAIFTLPVTLYFFATRESPTPVFSLSFGDATTKLCKDEPVSRGGIKSPGIAKSSLESVEWLGIGWGSTPYDLC